MTKENRKALTGVIILLALTCFMITVLVFPEILTFWHQLTDKLHLEQHMDSSAQQVLRSTALSCILISILSSFGIGFLTAKITDPSKTEDGFDQ